MPRDQEVRAKKNVAGRATVLALAADKSTQDNS